MQYILKFGAGLCLFMLMAVEAQESAQHRPAQSLPSQQLLEFLADFGAIDNQTYELIEYHALQDSNKDQEKSNEN